MHCLTVIALVSEFIVGQGLAIHGRLRFDAASLRPPANLSVASVVFATPEDATTIAKVEVGLLPASALASAAVSADGTFEVDSLAPGTYIPYVMFVPSGWRVKSIMSGGEDVTDKGITVVPVTCPPNPLRG